MIQSRIEYRLVRFIGVAHLITFQFLVPFVVSFLFQGIEVEVILGEFGLQVVLRSFHIDSGDGDAHDDRLAVLHIKVEICLHTVALRPGFFP